MSSTTPVNGWTIPDLSDGANIVEAVAGPILMIDNYVVPRYASVTARNSAIPAPTMGQLAYVVGTEELYKYNGTAWVGVMPRSVYCTADQQVTDNNVSLVDSLYLKWSVEANSVYKVFGSLRWVNSVSNNDTRIGSDVPAGCTGDWIIAHPAPASTYTDNPAVPWGASHGYAGSAASSQRGVFTGFLKTGVNAGTVTMQFCEYSAPAGVTWVKLAFGSELSILKIG